jgi:hypothetical protein
LWMIRSADREARGISSRFGGHAHPIFRKSSRGEFSVL